MDIAKDPSLKKQRNRKRILIASGLVLMGCVLLYGVSRDAVSVSRENIVIATVKSGRLNVTVEGYGYLRSDNLSRSTATSNAIVKEVKVKPGARVKKGDVIAIMVNPEVEQMYENAKNEFAKANANLKHATIDSELQLLNERQLLKEAEVNHAVAKTKADAQATLVDQGTISKFQFLDISAEEQRQRARVDFLREKVQTVERINQEMIRVQQGLVAQQEGELLLAKRKLNDLTVKADSPGILQKLAVEAGQSVTPGQEIAVVGSTEELVGFVKVPQNKVNKIQVGDKAIVDNNQEHVEGRVARIEPVVVDNTVEVEVELPKQLPATFKAQQNIDAKIVVRVVESALFIERPARSAENKEMELYLVDDDGKHGSLVKLKLGEYADNYIEIKGGAKVGQRLIISDLSNLAAAEKGITLE